MDNNNIHTKNGLVQKSIVFNSGFKITISIATGVCGESTGISIYDSNIYPDDDKGERTREYIIPVNHADDLLKLSNLIKEVLEQRNSTLIKNSEITKDWLEEIGWKEVTHYSYIHKDFSAEVDGFFLELKPGPNNYYQIVEENCKYTEIVFTGYLESKDDMVFIMNKMIYWKNIKKFYI